jgi:alanine racemase
MVRPGSMLYGFYPSKEVDHKRVNIKQVMTLHAQISHVKTVPTGRGISYGLTYITDKETRVATIPMGYADGYKRSLSNRGYIEIKNKRVSVIGRVCQDQFLVDVSDIHNVKVGDEVVLMGYPGGVAPDGEEMAKMMDTVTAEVTCQITRRVPRIYTRNGKLIAVKNYLA